MVLVVVVVLATRFVLQAVRLNAEARARRELAECVFAVHEAVLAIRREGVPWPENSEDLWVLAEKENDACGPSKLSETLFFLDDGRLGDALPLVLQKVDFEARPDWAFSVDCAGSVEKFPFDDYLSFVRSQGVDTELLSLGRQ